MRAVWSAFWLMMICSISLTASGSHKDSPCCLIPRPGQCKYACENIPASKYVSNLTRKSSVTEDLESVCSHEKRGFWSCINRHLRGNLWIGSACCHRGHGWHCQAACVNATSLSDLQRSCRRSDEVELYNCLEQKLKSDQCCRKAKGNRDCAAACRDAVSAELVGVSEAIVSKLTSSCAKSPDALECVSRQLGLEQGDTQDTTSEGRVSESAEARLVCCEESSARACQDVCRSVLISGSGEQDIMDELVAACGEPNLTDKLWQCILKSSTNSKSKEDSKHKQQLRSPSGPRQLSGVRSLKDKPVLSDEVDLVESPSPYTKIQVFADYDYFEAFRQHATSSKKKLEDFPRHKKLANDLLKVKCCNKESIDDCRNLCQEVYTDDYSRILDFEKKCLNNPTGSEMQGCLLDVEEPCQLGCDGLNFCSLFNQRPAETFRSCTIASDNAAQIDYASWVSGKSSISFLQHRLSLNVTRCHPEMWQAFSCYHHIKPCGRRRGNHSGTPKICMKDCYSMLNECLPDSDGAEIANYVCSIFASASDSDCISLTEYLNFDQKKMGAQTQITVPCVSSNSCSENQVCQPERRQDSTLSQTCRAGCRLGESSAKMVPTGAWITAPCGAEGCRKICRCDESGAFDKCVKLPTVKSKPCIVGNREIEHGSQFAYDCNVCGCNAGELTCTKRKCHHLSSSSRRTLPCKCPEDHEPVCGRNGKTYPNHCIARCNLQTGVTAGPCSQPAEESRAHCLSGHIAVARTSVCLAYRKFQEALPCEQFVCVSTKAGNCIHENLGAVCDIYGQTHITVCDFARAQVPLAHWGVCQRNCSHVQVCGIDGQTYKTECVSKANHVPTDFTGACNSFAASCSTVQCPPTQAGCKIVTPPGACCPKCLSYIRMVLSNKQLYKLVMAAESQNFVSVSYILSILRTFVSVSECKLGGYLHYEGDLIVYTYSEEGAYEVCEVELERIYEAFLRQSAQVQLDPVLSAVVAVDLNTGQGGSLISGAKSVQAAVSTFLLQVTMLCYYY